MAFPCPHASGNSNHPLIPFLKTCKTIDHLKQIHAHSLKSFHTSITTPQHLYLYSRLIQLSITALDADLNYSSLLLRHHPISPNSFIYNTFIKSATTSSSSSDPDLPLHLYLHMLSADVAPSKHTYPLLLKSCSRRFLLLEGRQIHTHSVVLGFGSDVYVNNSLIHFYAACGHMNNARKVFDGMADRTVVSWNSLIHGYVSCGEHEAGIGQFREMQIQKIFVPDGFTIQSVASACGNMAAPTLAMWVHRFCNRIGSASADVLVGNSLLDMYSKCGCISMARQLFETMPHRNLASWNHMILGFAMNGLVQESLKTFQQLCNIKHLSPNHITFIGLLTACNHGGMVAHGLRYFKSMVIDFNIDPSIEHYGCLIDLLGRAGLVREALAVTSTMTCEPDIVIWRSLLDNHHKKKARGECNDEFLEDDSLFLARQILESEHSAGGFVLVSKMHTARKRWEDATIIRRLMDEQDIQKQAGCSLIEIDNCVHHFLSGNCYSE